MDEHLPRLIKRALLDEAAWNACIDRSGTGLVYPYSFFLDRMAPQWDALVLGDYAAVMPMTWRQKYGLRYLYQPAFTQQLGIFSQDAVDCGIFLGELRRYFLFAEIFLNYTNHSTSFQPRINYILELNKPYDTLRKTYRSSFQHATLLELKHLSGADEIIDQYSQLYGKRMPKVRTSDYKNFRLLCADAALRGMLVTRGAFNAAGKMVGGILLLKTSSRLHLLMTVNPPQGRQEKAVHFLIDQLIREFAGQPLILDFEGSEIPGVAFFFENFGAVKQPYSFFRLNSLPPLFRWLKPFST